MGGYLDSPLGRGQGLAGTGSGPPKMEAQEQDLHNNRNSFDVIEAKKNALSISKVIKRHC